MLYRTPRLRDGTDDEVLQPQNKQEDAVLMVMQQAELFTAEWVAA